MSKNELAISLEKFQKAYDRLEELFEKEIEKDVLRDAVIQRFEFTYELCWKTLKWHLNEKGILCSSPKECFQKALGQGLIQPEEESIFLKMLKDRNLTSHTYDETTVDEIFKNINEYYRPTFGTIISRL